MNVFRPLKQLLRSYLPDKRIYQIQDAYFFSCAAHEGQLRSSGEPYITHPVAVAAILAKMRLDYETIIAALLHDVIEDTHITYQNITDRYGLNVAKLVKGLSKLDKLKFRNRQEAQAENFRKMVMAMVKDIRVILIKLADRTHNMRTLDSLKVDKRRRIAKETLEIYAPLAYRLGIQSLKNELEELGFFTLYPYRAQVIKKVVNAARRTRREMIQKILTEIQQHLNQFGVDANIKGHEKTIYNIYLKMKQKEQKFHTIMDIYDFHILVKDVDTCYRVLGMIHNLYKPRVDRFRDYIAIPKVNGYQSLHTSTIGSGGVPVEIQIRTEEMNQNAEMGVIAHWDFSEKDELNSSTAHIKVQNWMRNLQELQQSVGSSVEFIENVKSDLFPKEIYVFTPKGRIIELPEGATSVDFAYAVHTDIGHHCIGATVNHKPYPLFRALGSGQTVEIVIDETSLPTVNWLNFVVSSKARTHIRQLLKNSKRKEAISLGRRLLNHALLHLGGIDNIPQYNLTKALKTLKLNSFDDLLADIGLGNIMTSVIANGLKNNNFVNSSHSANRHKLVIKSAPKTPIEFGKCCYPIPFDPVIGYVDPTERLTIHHQSCGMISNVKSEQKTYIPFQWTAKSGEKFTAQLDIYTRNNQFSLSSIISVIDSNQGTVQKLNTSAKQNRLYQLNMLIEVNNTEHLANIMTFIKKLPNVIRVNRPIH